MKFEKKNKRKFNRFTGLLLVMVLIFGILINKMVQLQVIHGEEYAERANTEFIKNIMSSAPRGEITDKNGVVLATSAQSYNLIYVDTTESRKVIYTTMDKVIALLEKSGQAINDTFNLKLDPYRFEFASEDADYIKTNELRWKKDRGINDYLFSEVLMEETGKSMISELNEAETDRLNELILAFSPEETYYYLISHYQLYEALVPVAEEMETYSKMTGKEIYDELLKEFTPEKIRAYLIIRDSIAMESYQGSRAVTLVDNMNEESAFTFLQQLNFLPGIDVETTPIRLYPFSTLASHILGYLNPIPAGSEDYYAEKGYDISSDYIGVSGIESAYEDILKGSKGVSTVRVDKNGRTVSELFEVESYLGSTVKLSIDANLQNAAEKALEETIIRLSTEETDHFIAGYWSYSNNATRGAVVALDVKTGKVRALASYPDYDPNVFAIPGRLTSEMYKEYFTPDYRAFAEEFIAEMGLTLTPEELFRFNDDGTVTDNNDIYAKPFFNYATQGLTPSGSTFKVITSLAALEENVVTPTTIIHDTGVYTNPKLGGYKVTNDGGSAYGSVNLVKAIAKSSNVYYVDMGYKLYSKNGLNALAKWSWALGLGHDPSEEKHSTTGIEISENINGNVYNHVGKVELTKKLIMFDLVDFLLQGKRRVVINGSGTFTPLNISKNDADEEDIALAKDAIKTAIKNVLDITLEEANAGQTASANDFVKVLEPLIQDFIDVLPEDQRTGLNEAKDYASELSSKVIFDTMSQLISPVNVMSSAIGQGDNQLNLLQIANSVATIANGGTRYRTSLVGEILDADGNVIEEVEPEILSELDIKESNVQAILEALHASTLPGGGAYSVFKKFPIATGGKTGTATVKEDQEKYGRAAFGVYTAVAPIDDPEIVVVAIIYDATRGYFAAPITLAVFEEYFKDKLKTSYPDYERQFNYELPAQITEYGEEPETPLETPTNSNP